MTGTTEKDNDMTMQPKGLIPAAFCVILVCMGGTALAAPSISSTSGTWSQGDTLTVSGSDFGNTGKEVPIKFDDFESGVVGASR